MSESQTKRGQEEQKNLRGEKWSSINLEKIDTYDFCQFINGSWQCYQMILNTEKLRKKKKLHASHAISPFHIQSIINTTYIQCWHFQYRRKFWEIHTNLFTYEYSKMDIQQFSHCHIVCSYTRRYIDYREVLRRNLYARFRSLLLLCHLSIHSNILYI